MTNLQQDIQQLKSVIEDIEINVAEGEYAPEDIDELKELSTRLKQVADSIN